MNFLGLVLIYHPSPPKKGGAATSQQTRKRVNVVNLLKTHSNKHLPADGKSIKMCWNETLTKGFFDSDLNLNEQEKRMVSKRSPSAIPAFIFLRNSSGGSSDATSPFVIFAYTCNARITVLFVSCLFSFLAIIPAKKLKVSVISPRRKSLSSLEFPAHKNDGKNVFTVMQQQQQKIRFTLFNGTFIYLKKKMSSTRIPTVFPLEFYYFLFSNFAWQERNISNRIT